MVNPHVAFLRRKDWLASKGIKSLADMQELDFTYNWTRPATPNGGDTTGTGPQNQPFPARATMVLGIYGSAFPDTQPGNPFVPGNQRYYTSFQYNVNQQGLVVPNSGFGGLAETVFGQFGDQFPGLEICLEANDQISVNIQSSAVSDTAIHGTILYRCLVYKYAQ